jgi:LCP family protein required for cell wall assembly
VFIGIVGTDDRPGVSGARADAVHVVGINPAKRRGTIIDIPRDTYINIPGRGSGRINEAHVGGNAPLMAQTLRSFTGAPVRYLITTNFEGFTGVVDAMNGVLVDVPYDIFDSSSGANFPKGKKILSGSQALAMARARKSVPGGDFGRTENQGRLLLSGLRQVQKTEPGPAQTIRMVGILLQHVKTSDGVRPGDLYNLARLAMTVEPGRISNVVMPGTTGSAGGASVVFPAGNYRQVFADFADDAIVGG